MDINKLLLNHGILKTNLINDHNEFSPPISNFEATILNTNIVLTWVNPSSIYFSGVRIQRKIGGYPTSVTDGETVFQGIATSFTDIESKSMEIYYYRAFTYNTTLSFNIDPSQQISINYDIGKIYTIVIDTNNNNPFTSVTYADDAMGMTGGSNDWDSIYPFSEIKPVMFKNGVVNYYLNPDNFTQKFDGTPSNITDGNDGDVMIQFPKFYTFIRKEGSLMYVSLSRTKINTNYQCYAHGKLGIEKNHVYIGTYMGSTFDLNSKSVLNSLSGQFPTTNQSMNSFRVLTENKGSGYQIVGYAQILMLQVLYLIKYKNLNSQVAVGRGYVDATSLTSTGATDTLGMTYGTQTANARVKLFGLEDIWGNIYSWIEGILIKPNGIIALSDGNFNSDAEGYLECGLISYTDKMGYVSSVMGGNETGFIPSELSGTISTNYCDQGWLYVGTLNGTACFGGNYDHNDKAGIFTLEIGDSFDAVFYTVGARLAYV